MLASCTASPPILLVAPVINLHRCHPAAGQLHSVSIGSTTALQTIQVEYFGHRYGFSHYPNGYSL